MSRRRSPTPTFSGRAILLLFGFLTTTAFSAQQKDDFAIACAGALVTTEINGARLRHGLVQNRTALCGCILSGLENAPPISNTEKQGLISYFQRVAGNVRLAPKDRRTTLKPSTRQILRPISARCQGKFSKPAAFSKADRILLVHACENAILGDGKTKSRVQQSIVDRRSEVCRCVAEGIAVNIYLSAEAKQSLAGFFRALGVKDRKTMRAFQQRFHKQDFNDVRKLSRACVRQLKN